MNETISVIVAVLVLVAPIPHAVAFGILHGAVKRGEPIAALVERRNAAAWWLGGSLVISALVLNGMLGRPVPIVSPWTQLIIGSALLAGSMPAVLFIVRWARGGFRD